MAEFGYTMLCEQTPPKQLVTDLVRAEAAGFDFSVISDHYFPWLERQGHSPYAWSVLGAAAHATERIPLMTFVTCPTIRYHPAVVAQKAATMGALSDGRFTLGVGAGENLNEHVVGRGWPSADIRHEMLAEAVEIIHELFEGGYVNYRGEYYDVESAKLYDRPDRAVPIAMAVSGGRSVRLAAKWADALIATEPDGALVAGFEEAGGRAIPSTARSR
jgi:G6PDH family F420-dependent oxidoreductase